MQRILLYENMTSSRLLLAALEVESSSRNHMDDCWSRRRLPTFSGMSIRQQMGMKEDGSPNCKQALLQLAVEASVVSAPNLLAHQSKSRSTGARVSNINMLPLFASLGLVHQSTKNGSQGPHCSFALLGVIFKYPSLSSIGCNIAIGRKWEKQQEEYSSALTAVLVVLVLV